MFKTLILGLTVVAFAGLGTATAQTPAPGGIKRTPLQKIEFPKGYNVVTVVAEIPADTLAGRHTHPGIDTGYVLEGDATLIVEGKPDQALKAGDSYAVPAGIPHDVKTGPKGLKIMAVYVVEEGKPVATAAPK